MKRGAEMKKTKYEEAIMEIVEFDFEDILDTSDQDNIGDASMVDNSNDLVGMPDQGETDLGSGGW